MVIEREKQEKTLWQIRLHELIGRSSHKKIETPYARVDIQRGSDTGNCDWTVRITGLQSGLREVIYELDERDGLVLIRGVNSLPYNIAGLQAGIFSRIDPNGECQNFELKDESVPHQLKDAFRNQVEHIVRYVENANRNAKPNNIGSKKS
ncbi:hypothetical protein A3F02_00505 [Candidatus Curtissbacteria bacterium RIFCSPHIGHO2_12_FULL_38_9b]|uniref:Uncharacterized protein n=1 Tax=Candidatus Curtissbacteria bacterium RIFCSPHIGHO2_12_FULL_38_9b TaxID=1797720 RepID=A0A1F5GYP9_9BACT|nr:MAG: hypothetical protein A3F02_00505 [Candidatus Curtissbacteria bacterium RIFCSPHIGHO2_12_FULL_38_9b]